MLTIPEAIKEKLHLDSCKKNIRIHFPNGERSDICNNMIVKDSVKFTESVCSQDVLKFGLSESSQFECEVVGVSNVQDAQIEVACEIYCDASVSGAVWRADLQAWVYPIPYGTFVIKSCQRQSDVLHRKFVCYGGVQFAKDELHIFERIKQDDWDAWKTTYNPKDVLFAMVNTGAFVGCDSLFDRTLLTDYQSSQTSDKVVFVFSPDGGYHQYVVKWGTQTNHNFTYTSGIDNLFEIKVNPQEIFAARDKVAQFAIQNGCPTDLAYDSYYMDAFVDGWLLESWDTQSGDGAYARWGEQEYERTTFHIGFPETFQFYGHRPPNNQLHLEIVHHVGGLYITDGMSGPVVAEDSSEFTFTYSFEKLTLKSQYSIFNNPRLSFPYYYDDEEYKVVHRFDCAASNAQRLDAMMELCGLFGMMGRSNKFQAINIQRKYGLLPDTDLYPSETLYPQAVGGEHYSPSDYQSCWYDDDYIRPVGCIKCVYKNLNGNEKSYVTWVNGFSSQSPLGSYSIYDISENYYMQTYQWARASIVQMCDNIAANVQNVEYMPMSMVGRGYPYVEAGDTFEVTTPSGESITTIALSRTISGEQLLTDSIKSV